jgi:predicted N-acetyltransferase YhbS
MTEYIDALRIEPVSKLHNRKDFKCRKDPLTQYIQRFARQNDENNIAKTFVAVDDDNNVLGYYSLSTASIEFEDLPEDFAKGLPRYPIPAALIAKLAVDSDVGGQGLGSRLLIEALQNILAVSEEMAVKVVLVVAIDEEAKGYYLRFGFITLPGKDLKLFLPIETISQLLTE